MQNAHCLAAWSVAACWLTLYAQGVHGQSIGGRVLERESGTPVATATIELLASGQSMAITETNGSGSFEIDAGRTGQFQIRVARVGYVTFEATVEIAAAGIAGLILRVDPAPIPAAELAVEVESGVPALARVGFYDRRTLGHGRFIERRDIEERNPRETSDLLRGLPGVRVLRSRSGTDVEFRQSGILSLNRRPDSTCRPPVFLDGLIISHPRALPDERYDLDSLLHGDIEAIELYSGPAQVPAQYGGASSACGVLLIWTRH
jgi:hypothetical protein